MTPSPEGKGPHIPDPQLFRAAVHAIGDGVTLADGDGRIIYSNPAADRILGVGASSGPPEEWADYYGVFLPDKETPFPEDEYPLVRAVRGQSSDNVEMFVRNEAIPHGAMISATGRPVRDSHGEIIGAVVVFRDITRLRRIEEQKRELTGFLIHDMKSPLSSILGGADLALHSDGVAEEDREVLEGVRNSARKLLDMVMDLMDVQMAEEGRLKPEKERVDLSSLLEEVRESVAPGAGEATIEVDCPPGLELTADPELLRRVVTNLVDNCLKYGPGDGRIWIDAGPEGDDRVGISVSDEGPGIPEELRGAVFERYASVEREGGRRHPDSRGLGLRFCRVAVEAHDGRIWVEDNEPVGARFRVELPSA